MSDCSTNAMKQRDMCSRDRSRNYKALAEVARDMYDFIGRMDTNEGDVIAAH